MDPNWLFQEEGGECFPHQTELIFMSTDKNYFHCFQLSIISSHKIAKRQGSQVPQNPVNSQRFQNGTKRISINLFCYSKVKLFLAWITKGIRRAGKNKKKKLFQYRESGDPC